MGCCDELIKLGTSGEDGTDGISAYTYVAYADNVVFGTPDVVTNFSLTSDSNKEWIAFITSATVMTPVETDFENKWIKVKGAVSAPLLTLKNNGTTVMSASCNIIDFIGSGLTGVTVADAGGGEADVTIVTAGLVSITRASALTLMGTNLLTPGATYWIYDVGDGIGLGATQAGIILKAITTSQFSTDGIFVARVINRTTVTSFYNPAGAYAINGYVENLNEVYQNITGVNGGVNPAQDVVNWSYIAKSNSVYQTEIQGCKYDITNNIIKSRWDYRNNILENSSVIANSNELILQGFRWGTNTVINNKIQYSQTAAGWSSNRLPNDVTTLLLSTLRNNVKNNIIINSSIADTAFNYINGTILNNYIENSTVTFNDVFTNFDYNTIKNGSTINIYVSQVFEGNNLEQSQVDINPNCQITYNSGLLGISNNSGCLINLNSSISAASSIVSNTDCDIQSNIVNLSSISSNTSLLIVGNYLLLSNLNYNISTVTPSDVQIQSNIFKNSTFGTFGQPITYNTAFVIYRGVMTNSMIRDVVFDNTVTFSGYAGTSGTEQLVDFEINDLFIDGAGSTLPFIYIKVDGVSSDKTSSGIKRYSFQAKHENCNMVTGLDMSDAAIFNAGVLTIPATLDHVGVFYLHDTALQNITSISGLYSSSNISYMNATMKKSFRVIDGTGVTFTPTAYASLGANNFASDGGAVTLINKQDVYTFKKIDGIVHKVEATVLI